MGQIIFLTGKETSDPVEEARAEELFERVKQRESE